jgi:hypothetical protein
MSAETTAVGGAMAAAFEATSVAGAVDVQDVSATMDAASKSDAFFMNLPGMFFVH